MLVLFAMIVVNVRADYEFTHRLKAFGNALSLQAIREVRVANIKIDAQAGEAGLIDERGEVGWLDHFRVRVFDANGYARVASVQRQVLEGTEGRIALAWVSGLPRVSHMEKPTGKGRERGRANDTFQLIHGLDATYASHPGAGQGTAAFTLDGEIAASGR